MARYLVTGGAGFIGSSITRALLARGDSVRVLDNFSSGYESNLEGLDGDLEVLRGDVSKLSDLERAVRQTDGVFHEAAVASVQSSIREPVRCDEVNILGTLLVLEAARQAGVRRVVFAASAAAYGDDPELPKRESMRPAPLSPYALSKVAGEHYIRVYALLYGMQTMALRYFNVFGPRQDPASEYAAAIPIFVDRLLRGVRPVIYGDGLQTRDFCYIDSVVDANLRAMGCERAEGQVVNVATGHSITVVELIAMLNRALGTSLEPEHADPRPGDVRFSSADISVARELLGYEPTTEIEVGLARTVAYFKERTQLENAARSASEPSKNR